MHISSRDLTSFWENASVPVREEVGSSKMPAASTNKSYSGIATLYYFHAVRCTCTFTEMEELEEDEAAIDNE